LCIAAGAAIVGGISVAKAKADHDAEIEKSKEYKQPHELSSEELKVKCPPMREHYESPPSVVGKDVLPATGMRVRMSEGLISQGTGTIVELYDDAELAGSCAVIWDSDECHTRPLHERLGNKHLCRVGKCGDFDLVLAETTVCNDIQIREHTFVQSGLERKHLEVIRTCHRSAKQTVDTVTDSTDATGQ